jgi:hypothetical protein
MGYSITIGNAVAKSYDEDSSSELWVGVERTSHPEAPVLPGDDMTGNGNARHPSYTQWSNFCRAVGLHDMFFNKESGLMAAHPGARRLTHAHYEEIAEALNRWKREHPTDEPGWCGCPVCDQMGKAMGKKNMPEHRAGLSGELGRLVWLEWWVRWALSNATLPAIYNS